MNFGSASDGTHSIRPPQAPAPSGVHSRGDDTGEAAGALSLGPRTPMPRYGRLIDLQPAPEADDSARAAVDPPDNRASQACAAARQGLTGLFGRIWGGMSGLAPGQRAPARIAFTEDRCVPEVSIHIAVGFLTARETAHLAAASRNAYRIAGPLVAPQGLLACRQRAGVSRQRLANLHSQLQEVDSLSQSGFLCFYSPWLRARIPIFAKIRKLAPEVLRNERAMLDRMDPTQRAQQVAANRAAYLEAMRTLRLLPSDPEHALPAESNGTGGKAVEAIPPRQWDRFVMYQTRGGNIHVAVGDRDGREVYLLSRKSLEDFAAVMGSSLAGVVEWMATVASANLDHVGGVIGGSLLTNVPMAYEHHHEECGAA